MMMRQPFTMVLAQIEKEIEDFANAALSLIVILLSLHDSRFLSHLHFLPTSHKIHFPTPSQSPAYFSLMLGRASAE
jgi:hypothetical protein